MSKLTINPATGKLQLVTELGDLVLSGAGLVGAESAGAVGVITIGSGLSLSGGVLSATGGGGGSQTPWTSDIDGDNHALTEVASIQFNFDNGGTPTAGISITGAGNGSRSFLTFYDPISILSASLFLTCDNAGVSYSGSEVLQFSSGVWAGTRELYNLTGAGFGGDNQVTITADRITGGGSFGNTLVIGGTDFTDSTNGTDAILRGGNTGSGIGGSACIHGGAMSAGDPGTAYIGGTAAGAIGKVVLYNLNFSGTNYSWNSQESSISDPSGVTTDQDVEARAAIGSILTALRNKGIIAT